MWVTPAVTAFSSVAQLVKRRANVKFAPALFPRVFHFGPARSARLPERLSLCVLFLLCRDVPTFSPVFKRLTVFSTVTFGGTESAPCGLLCPPGRAIYCQTLAVVSIVSCACARPGFHSSPGSPQAQIS